MAAYSAKVAAVTETFGKVDPKDASHVQFLYARRGCATVRERGRRELIYVIELDEVERLTLTTLDRIRERDGERIYREAAAFLRKATKIADR